MKLKSTFDSYLFILPAVTIFSVFYLIPFFWVFYYSMLDWEGLTAITRDNFVFLGNFWNIMTGDPDWWQSIWNAGYITVIALTFQNILAFALAWACDREIRMKHFYRMVFFIPPVLSEIVVGMVWRFIINDYGGANLINRGLTFMGLGTFAHSWLSDPKTVLSTVAVVHCWKGFGWGFLIFLAGLQTIPKELYEAAKVDGANAWQSFKTVTIPLMVPVIVTVGILTVLGTMQAFVLIMSLVQSEVGGHTTVPVLEIYGSMNGGQFGYAAAQGITLGAVLVAISIVQNRLSKWSKATV